MRLLVVFFIIIMWLIATPNTTYAGDRDCVGLHNLFNELEEHGGKTWFGFQLKKNEEVWYLVFTQKNEQHSDNEQWAIYTRFSKDRPDIYCILGKGIFVEPLRSLHDTSFVQKYGMPGSGYPRCGEDIKDPLESLRVRSWANRELGDSIILSLNSNDGTSYVLLMSRYDGFWILLDRKPDHTTCYFDRGERSDMRNINITAD